MFPSSIEKLSDFLSNLPPVYLPNRSTDFCTICCQFLNEKNEGKKENKKQQQQQQKKTPTIF